MKDRPRVVAVANLKGGSGKSTTAVNLSAALAERGFSVLVIDLDGAQSTSARWLGAGDVGEALLDVFRDGAPLIHAITPSRVPGVDVASPSPALRDDALAGYPLAVAALQRAVRTLPKGYSWIIMDTPPALGVLSLSALLASREVLATVEASAIAAAGLPALASAVDEAAKASQDGDATSLRHVLLCRFDGRTLAAQELRAALIEAYGGAMLETVIRATVRHMEAAALGEPITVYDSTGAGAADYRAVADELIKRGAP